MRDLCGCCDYAAALNLQPHNHSESSLHNTNHLARGICHRSVIKLCNVCTYTWRMRSARRYLRPELFYSSRDGRKIFRAMINQLQRTRWRRSHTGDYFDWLIGWLIGRWWWWWLDGCESTIWSQHCRRVLWNRDLFAHHLLLFLLNRRLKRTSPLPSLSNPQKSNWLAMIWSIIELFHKKCINSSTHLGLSQQLFNGEGCSLWLLVIILDKNRYIINSCQLNINFSLLLLFLSFLLQLLLLLCRDFNHINRVVGGHTKKMYFMVSFITRDSID